MGELNRGERLQIMLTQAELRIVDTWRFAKRMPSRAAAIRELLKRGMAAEGFGGSRGRPEVEGLLCSVGQASRVDRWLTISRNFFLRSRSRYRWTCACSLRVNRVAFAARRSLPVCRVEQIFPKSVGMSQTCA